MTQGQFEEQDVQNQIPALRELAILYLSSNNIPAYGTITSTLPYSFAIDLHEF